MVNIHDFYQFCKQQQYKRLRDELGRDVCLMLENEASPPRSLFDYLPQGQLVLRSGYTTQPGATTAIVEMEMEDAS